MTLKVAHDSLIKLNEEIDEHFRTLMDEFYNKYGLFVVPHFNYKDRVVITVFKTPDNHGDSKEFTVDGKLYEVRISEFIDDDVDVDAIFDWIYKKMIKGEDDDTERD